MPPDTAFIVIATLLVGAIAGWHFRVFRGASADLRVHQARVPAFKAVRRRSGLIAVSLVVLTLLALRDLIR